MKHAIGFGDTAISQFTVELWRNVRDDKKERRMQQSQEERALKDMDEVEDGNNCCQI